MKFKEINKITLFADNDSGKPSESRFKKIDPVTPVDSHHVIYNAVRLDMKWISLWFFDDEDEIFVVR